MTGGAGGIGAASCSVFADRDARVVVADIDVERAGAQAEQVNAGKAEAMAVGVDLAREKRIVAMFDAVRGRFCRLKIMERQNSGVIVNTASDKSTYVTGADFRVDGGATAW